MALPDIPTRKMTSTELYENCHSGVLVVGHLYNCKQCGRQHAIVAGGFAITASGVIVTTYHVVNQPDALTIGAMTADGKVYAVKEVLAADWTDDVAILQLDGSGLTPLALSPEAPVGTSATMIHHPDGHFYSLTRGVISRYFATERNGKKVTWIAATAIIGERSYGAPLLNELGTVVGMASHTHSILDTGSENHPTPPRTSANVFAPAAAVLRLIGPTPVDTPTESTDLVSGPAERVQKGQTQESPGLLDAGRNLGRCHAPEGGRRPGRFRTLSLEHLAIGELGKRRECRIGSVPQLHCAGSC